MDLFRNTVTNDTPGETAGPPSALGHAQTHTHLKGGTVTQTHWDEKG